MLCLVAGAGWLYVLRSGAENAETAWALIGLVTFMNIAIDLELMGPRRRQQTFSAMAHFLLDGAPG